MRCAAVDVHYPETGGAWAALVVAGDIAFRAVVDERTVQVGEVAPYRPGRFYERELPAVRGVLTGAAPLDLIVVDGYVDLDPSGRPGLGAHVFAEFAVPVIGVAKTAFRSATHALPVRRGGAERPLYVTAAGMPPARAAEIVVGMAGPHRMPDALRRADRLARAAGALP